MQCHLEDYSALFADSFSFVFSYTFNLKQLYCPLGFGKQVLKMHFGTAQGFASAQAAALRALVPLRLPGVQPVLFITTDFLNKSTARSPVETQ